MLNIKLAEERGLGPLIQKKIQELQDNREMLKFKMAYAVTNESHNSRMKLLEAFRENEANLQKEWKFDDNAHMRFMEELKIPGCTCPYIDNKESRGLRRYVHADCPWHN